MKAIGRLAVIGVSLTLALSLIAGDASTAPGQQVKAGPFVTVYHDDAVALQVRRDRIKHLGHGVYDVWLRWLWAEPQPWKNQEEASRVVVARVDCAELRVRELGNVHIDRNGKVIDADEVSSLEEAPWKSFERGTGAGATIERLCEFVPKLLELRDSADPKK